MAYNEEMGEANEPDEGTESTNTLSKLLAETNIATKLDEDDLRKIGQDAKDGYTTDYQSCEDWMKTIDGWIKLAKQTIEVKTWPWPNSSNIKYPLLSTAAMQFAARAYPSLVPADGRVVTATVIGKDISGQKTDIAEAVSIYMSYQLLCEMEDWEEDMDKLLIMLPIIGTMFKKTYWDSIKETNYSRLVLPKNLIVNYWANSLKDSERISEVLEVNARVFKERVQSGLWLDIDIGDPSNSEHDSITYNTPSNTDESTPYIFIEQHCYLDLDDDEYPEPYIVTFHKVSGKVVRIVARYDSETMFFKDGKLTKIEPIEYYTKFGFIPNPDGGFYDIGFGSLLGPINEAVNTNINQLTDAGTISNLQGGYIGKGLRLRLGETKFSPGEWKVVNSTGDDIRKQIVPLPAKEPSSVLFQLMEALITSGKELASVAEIFVGKMPGQNTPATTTMASIDQGMKVFTAVYKRIYRSLEKEFNKLYRLNRLYINPNTIVKLVGMPLGPENFSIEDHRIKPAADPSAVSKTEKLTKAQGLQELMSAGAPLDVLEVTKRLLQAQEQPDWEKLIKKEVMQAGQMPPPQPPPPDPKIQALQAKQQLDMQAGQQAMAIAERNAQLDQQAKSQDLQSKAAEASISLAEKKQLAQLKIAAQVSGDQARISQAQQQHQQNLQHSQETHIQQMGHRAQVATPSTKGDRVK